MRLKLGYLPNFMVKPLHFIPNSTLYSRWPFKIAAFNALNTVVYNIETMCGSTWFYLKLNRKAL